MEELHKVSSERETHGLMAHSVRASEWNSVVVVVVGSKFRSGQLSIATYTSKNPSVVNTIHVYIYIYIYMHIYALYFTIKGIFVLKIFKLFLSWLFAHAKSGFIRKVRLISKFMTSPPRKQIVVIHILPNILGSKGDETMKFG